LLSPLLMVGVARKLSTTSDKYSRKGGTIDESQESRSC
jgi:hypothetical protein